MFMIVNFLLKHSSKRKGGGSPKLPKHVYHSIALNLTKDFIFSLRIFLIILM